MESHEWKHDPPAVNFKQVRSAKRGGAAATVVRSHMMNGLKPFKRTNSKNMPVATKTIATATLEGQFTGSDFSLSHARSMMNLPSFSKRVHFTCACVVRQCIIFIFC